MGLRVSALGPDNSGSRGVEARVDEHCQGSQQGVAGDGRQGALSTEILSGEQERQPHVTVGVADGEGFLDPRLAEREYENRGDRSDGQNQRCDGTSGVMCSSAGPILKSTSTIMTVSRTLPRMLRVD